MNETLDHPFDEVAASADEYIKKGGQVFQKFTCSSCGNRLTMDVPNVFYKTGTCDECGTVTDIEAQGCNYLVVLDSGSRSAKPTCAVCGGPTKLATGRIIGCEFCPDVSRSTEGGE